MKNNKERNSKAMLQETVARNISYGILKLQNSWVSSMTRLFNYLPSKIRITVLLLTGISLINWSIRRLSTGSISERSVTPIQMTTGPITQTLASDSLLFMEKIYESRKKH
ncbi:hypothetical protein [Pedobacter foliorum]|uniref:hypothetical protein n=1 Tax=Pedobacter foliorum TaxID=2739058 RepID=UPI001564E2CE|nr:hypothetical protein [Pedobacter foliorum]NRF41099.1 hypothetical protein [Pedobacter foliorum]